MTTRAVAGREIVAVCRRLYERGLISEADGNVSVRLDDGRVLATPSGFCKTSLVEAQLVMLAADGRVIGAGRPSSEIAMHLRFYRRRRDVGAVVHAHPPTATGFAVAGETIDAAVLPELLLQVGAVSLVPFAVPGTEAVADGFEPFLSRGDAFLMAHHGATTVGPTLRAAHRRMESLEQAAKIVIAARLVGRARRLPPRAVRALLDRRDLGSCE